MNKKQAKKIATALSGLRLLNCDVHGSCSGLCDDDISRVTEATRDLGWKLLQRAGFMGEAPDLEEIFALTTDC
jgi:hypothetical protein